MWDNPPFCFLKPHLCGSPKANAVACITKYYAYAACDARNNDDKVSSAVAGK